MFIVGAQQSEGTVLDSIIELDVNEEKWKEFPQKLTVPWKDVAALFVPSNMTNCDATNQKQKINK